MTAPPMLVVAVTLRAGPAAHVAVSVRPFRLRTVDGPDPPGTTNAILSMLRPFTVPALPAFVAFVAFDAVGTVPSDDSTMFVPVSASWPTSFELTARFAILERVTARDLMCFDWTARDLMCVDRTAAREMSSALTRARPGSAVAVPASATHSAMNATTIDGDGRRRSKRLIRSPLIRGFPGVRA